MHFSQIKVSDLILVNLDGDIVEGDEPINAAAFAIHSEIHKARPDVHAACHAHSVYGKAWSVFGKPLDMITQDSLRFYKSHSVFDNFGGIVIDSEEGIRIAQCLGQGKAVILQNHGLLTVGQSVDEAAFWFISLDKTCQAQLLADAASAGNGYKKQIIGDEEAKFSAEKVGGKFLKVSLCFNTFNTDGMTCRSREGLVSIPGVLRRAGGQDRRSFPQLKYQILCCLLSVFI